MSERDPVSTLLGELEGPVDPRAEFTDALRARLLEELAHTDSAPPRHGARRPRWAPHLRRPLLAGATALAVAAMAVAVVVASRPSPASAVDVIRQARRAFASTPPFQALIRLELNPDGSNVNRWLPKGETETVLVSYGGPRRFRAEIVGQRPRLRDLSPPGAYQVFDGRRLGSFDPRRPKIFESAAVSGYSPLEFLSWHGAYPIWDRLCGGPDSKVLADARIAGRDARHIRCGNFHADVWELWIDRQTGLLLKIVGQVGGDDTFLAGGPGTSAKGGFEIERLRYNPPFSRETFSVTAPSGAFDPGARLQAALAKLPPFHAVIAAYGRAGRPSYVDEVWWLNGHTWRSQRLLDRTRDPNFTGAGSFSVWAHGTLGSYNAHDKTFSRDSDVQPGPDPEGGQLLDVEYPLYSGVRCPIVGHERTAGRETDHYRCPAEIGVSPRELWIDAATGLTLRSWFPGYQMRVRSIEYHPHFPPGIFRFVPPRGSRNAQQLTNDPYHKTTLAPGKPAPNWNATTLAGKPFQLTDLRGKPVLLLLLPDWCSDPVCNELAPLEQAYQESNHRTQVIWVDILGGKAQGAKKLARLNHFTLPIVIDHKEASHKAWAFDGYPYLLLLDSRGRVIEAHFHQTTAQLTRMLDERRASS
jgi:peroxiredoxin